MFSDFLSLSVCSTPTEEEASLEILIKVGLWDIRCKRSTKAKVTRRSTLTVILLFALKSLLKHLLHLHICLVLKNS